MGELDGRVALVTGGTRGVGKVCALAVADMGCAVGVVYAHSDEDAEATVHELRRRNALAQAVKADLGDYEAVQFVFEEVEARLGPVSVLINNLGDHHYDAVADLDFEAWHRVMDNTIHSTFYCSQRALPNMRRAGWGRIINIGIAGAHRVDGVPMMAAEAAGKVAIASLTKTIALEEAENGITANMINLSFAPGKGTRPEDARAMAETVPMKRVAHPKDVVYAVQFFASPRSEYITGNVLNVTGGVAI
ncbi:MAG: 3-oxoacyl-ACP reductase FabG [Anaerolineae bacterium]